MGDDEKDNPSPPPQQIPFGLDYFAADAPERRTSRAANFALGVVLVSLFPFACGIINSLVAAQSYSLAVSGAHLRGAAVFLPAALLVCVVGLIRLITLRHWSGVLLAAIVLVTQMAIVSCIGVAWMRG